ncbi:MAG: hypothetical protein R3337_00420 [Gammaproteobacteria bacterium]|nr:hypothetical protein [Gammaproteobacteria bacterium]
MPARPNVSHTIQDPGIRSGRVPRSIGLVIGLTTAGVANQVGWYDNPAAAIAAHQDGPALEVALAMLAESGGPVGIMRMSTSVAADNSAVSQDVGSGPLITVAGSARYDHRCEIEITADGALGAAKFRYNLDGFSGSTDAQKSWSQEYTVPAGGSFAIPGTDLTLTFPAGTYNDGDIYSFTADCAASNSSDLATAFTNIAAINRDFTFVTLVTTANTGDESAHATLAAAFNSELNTLAVAGMPLRGMMKANIGNDDGAVATAYTAVTAPRVLALFSDVATVVKHSFVGYKRPRGSALSSLSARASAVRISTDLKRVESGPLPNIVEVFEDERTAPTGLDDRYITTLTSQLGLGTPFVTQGRLKAAEGSDYRLWPRGIVMDRICKIVFEEEQRFIGMGLRFNAGPDVGDGLNAAGLTVGALDPRDIKRLEARVNGRLRTEIMQQVNEEGELGHASGVIYRIDPTHDVASTETIVSDVNGVPLVYPSYVNSTLGWGTDL